LRKRKASDIEANDKKGKRDHGRKKPKEVHASAVASEVAAHTRQTTPSTSHEAGDELDDDDSENEALPVHESLLEGSKSRQKPTSTRKTKYVPDDETKEQRDRRSIFIGNVPSEVAKNRVRCDISFILKMY
jgi:nucleolar protein 12